MKKKIICALLALILVFNITMPKKAQAEALTMTALSAAVYAVMQSAGAVFNYTEGTAAGVQLNMEDSLRQYMSGQSIVEKFGSDTIRIVAGKLAIGQVLYNNILTFINWLKQGKPNNEPYPLFQGTIGGANLGGTNAYGFKETGISAVFTPLTKFGQANGKLYVDGVQKDSTSKSYPSGATNQVGTYWTISEHPSESSFYVVYYYYEYTLSNGSKATDSTGGAVQKSAISYTVQNQATLDVSSYNASGINTGQEWYGRVTGYEGSDTNLEQLLQEIFDNVSDNTLDVDGEVTDVITPTPEPTPLPTRPPVDNTVDGLNDLISGQDVISGQLENVGSEVGSIADTLEEALDIPTAQEITQNDGATFKFDLRTLFPFCIPFDLYNLVSIFDTDPVTPHFALPFNIPAIGLQYTFDVDFSDFDGVAAILRNVELVAFCVGLALATRKVIRW